MKYWIIADTHFGHNKIKEYCHRPDDYEKKILDNIDRCVKNDDVLIHLGDFAFYKHDYWASEYHRITKVAATWIVLGNHDKKSLTYYQKWFNVVVHGIYLEYMGEKIYFSHKPIADNGYTINIHGHFHNVEHHYHEPELASIKNENQYLVAIENTGYAPITLDSILRGRVK